MHAHDCVSDSARVGRAPLQHRFLQIGSHNAWTWVWLEILTIRAHGVQPSSMGNPKTLKTLNRQPSCRYTGFDKCNMLNNTQYVGSEIRTEPMCALRPGTHFANYTPYSMTKRISHGHFGCSGRCWWALFSNVTVALPRLI